MRDGNRSLQETLPSLGESGTGNRGQRSLCVEDPPSLLAGCLTRSKYAPSWRRRRPDRVATPRGPHPHSISQLNGLEADLRHQDGQALIPLPLTWSCRANRPECVQITTQIVIDFVQLPCYNTVWSLDMRTVAAYPGRRARLAASRGHSGLPPRQFLIDTAVAIRRLGRSDLRARPVVLSFQPVASSLQNSNRGCQELEIAASPAESATSIFLSAVAAQGKAPHCDPQSLEPGAPNRHRTTSVPAFSSFQPLASSLQNSNNAQKELKIDLSPTESATSIFLIAVAPQGEAPRRDTQLVPQNSVRTFSEVRTPTPGRPLTSHVSSLTSDFLIDTNRPFFSALSRDFHIPLIATKQLNPRLK